MTNEPSDNIIRLTRMYRYGGGQSEFVGMVPAPELGAMLTSEMIVTSFAEMNIIPATIGGPSPQEARVRKEQSVKVIENRVITMQDGSRARRLWCMDTVHSHDECAVFADVYEAAEVEPGDSIWWQCGKIYWTRRPYFTDKPLRKISASFDPRST